MMDSPAHPPALGIRPYTRGLHDLGDGAFAYLQPDGSWGWSNAGLLVAGDDALLVDTLFDLSLTSTMLESMRRADPRAERIGKLVNTHSNRDHTNGNSLVAGAEIIASERAAAEMRRDDPRVLAKLMRDARAGSDPVSRYLVRCFGAFDFEGIPASSVTRTFTSRLELQVGDKRVELIEVGSAHTAGDIVIHVPGDRLVFAGDILFIGAHPIMWAGPIANWIAACDLLLSLDAEVIVPGHGPVTDRRGVTAVREYLSFVAQAARQAHDAGAPAAAAARSIAAELARGPYAAWNDGERVLGTVMAIYRDLDGAAAPPGPGPIFAAMAQFTSAG
jgi:cyclase